MKEILVTGGAGYIGSVTTALLVSQGYKVYVLDNFVTGNRELVHPEAELQEIDLKDFDAVYNFFLSHSKIDTVIHFAALSQVNESMKEVEKYYANNVLAGVNLLQGMQAGNVKKIIFSSSASVYGEPENIPITEKDTLKPVSVYGKTKAMFEKILKYFDRAYGIKYLSLRYFNAAGASDDYKYGERHDPETHLIPSIFKKIKAEESVMVFGDDYDTKDGTCIRDYIHVEDLAKAHSLGTLFLEKKNSEIINLGSGDGFSVREILDVCEKILGRKIGIKIMPRREGDPKILLASNEKAEKMLGWKPEKTIYDIVKSAYEFEQRV